MTRLPSPFPLVRAVAALIALALVGSPSVRADTADDCMGCHGEAGMTGTRDGKKIDVTIDRKKQMASVHGRVDCLRCHTDAKADGHDPGLKRVECGTCHERQVRDYRASAHGKAASGGDATAPRCFDCHGQGHQILAVHDPRSPVTPVNVPATCGRCHHEGTAVSVQHQLAEDRILENYSESIHGAGLYKKGLTVTAGCSSCHLGHLILPMGDPRASINRANVSATCQRCHQRIEQVHRKVINGKLWESEPNKVPICTDCHSPHKVRNDASGQGMGTKDCLVCHGKEELAASADPKQKAIYVNPVDYQGSTHGKTACAQCHVEVRVSKVRPCETIKSKVDCSSCHAAVVETYKTSIHGVLHGKNDPDAPACLDCHDKHATKSKKWPTSPTFPRNVPDLCGKCHRTDAKAAKRIDHDKNGKGIDIVKSYRQSIHGVGLLEAGLVVTATCADCHTAHGELPPADPKSTVNRANLVATCSKCHHGIGDVFQASVHGTSNTKAKGKLPVCEDCHTSHQISRTDGADFRMLMMSQCGNCHKQEAETFFDTYHGKVSRLGNARAAKCYDCHGTHDIRPPSDPASHLSRERVVETCAKCHEGSNRKFAGYLSHATHHDKKYPFLFYVFWAMTTLLVGTLAFALVHTGAWLYRLWRTKESWAALHLHTGPRKLVRRFTARQRAMHIIMLTSFLTLATTGMALKFAYMAWARVLANFLGGTPAMGGIHRLAAVTLVLLFAFHVKDLVKMKIESGKSILGFIFDPEGIMLGPIDLKEFIGSVKWFFGAGPRPAYGRWTYWEKFDYFAVFWGVFVIGSTGLVLWFPAFFTNVLPGWSINVATIIHSDEALLASGFIFTIHFFNTHFRPDKFPMDTVIFTGSVPADEYQYDKPREYQRLVDTGALEESIVPPMQESVERGFRVFGFTALAIGLTVVALIIYSVIFQYR